MTVRTTVLVLLLIVAALVSACGTGTARTGGPAPVQNAAPASSTAAAQARARGPAQAAAPAQDPAGAESQESATGEYRLGPGDVVKITVYNNPDLATEAEITAGGKIGFPLIGEVAVGGLTRSEAEKAIADSLGRGGFVPNAHVNLLVGQYRSQQVSVMGEVNKPGQYPISRAAGVTELLAMAGGITAKGSHIITVIQKDGNGRTVQQEIDVKRLFAGGPASNIRLGYDDVIYVPPMPVFYIYGEVRQPGSYPLTSDLTVRQALSLGGGLTVRGTERGIRLERKGKGNETLSRRPSLNDKLQPNDVLYVPESWF